MISEQIQSSDAQREWFDLRALQKYACVSERTLRFWMRRAENPLPASKVGAKILVRRSVFDRWLESQKLDSICLDGIVNEIIADVTNGR